jgi:hypothetical protein
MLRFRRLLSVVLVRGWLAFVVVACLGGGVAIVLDGDNPLQSDDPYLVGFICGLFAGAAALVYTLVEKHCSSRGTALALYASLLLAWCAFLLALGRVFDGLEGAAFYPYASAASLLSGLFAWITFQWRPHWRSVAILSTLGAAMFVMYGIAISRMAAEWK